MLIIHVKTLTSGWSSHGLHDYSLNHGRKLIHDHLMFVQRKGRLPACFARGFGLQVGPYVMLRDHNHNEIEVAIEKKNGKVYFADGWSFLKNFYGILAGGLGHGHLCKLTPLSD
jgi:hypothetical protein